jgi:3-polyprenyl-4-hydroxybenzoate decarboxylase
MAPVLKFPIQLLHTAKRSVQKLLDDQQHKAEFQHRPNLGPICQFKVWAFGAINLRRRPVIRSLNADYGPVFSAISAVAAALPQGPKTPAALYRSAYFNWRCGNYTIFAVIHRRIYGTAFNFWVSMIFDS